MIKRHWSACALAYALLLAATSSLAKDDPNTSPLVQKASNGASWRAPATPIPGMTPDPGDDDNPNRGGVPLHRAPIGTTSTGRLDASARDAKEWNSRDLMASLRLELLLLFRTLR